MSQVQSCFYQLMKNKCKQLLTVQEKVLVFLNATCTRTNYQALSILSPLTLNNLNEPSVLDCNAYNYYYTVKNGIGIDCN